MATAKTVNVGRGEDYGKEYLKYEVKREESLRLYAKKYSVQENPQTDSSIVKARSLALRFTAANPSCIRAIPYENDVKETKTFTMCIYVNADGKQIPDDLKQAANEMFSDYVIEYVDLQQQLPCKIVTRLAACKRGKDKTLKDLSRKIEKKLHIFENKLNVTAVQASYKVVECIEQDIPCVTVFVLGKGKIPVGESDIMDIKNVHNDPFGVPFDIVEGYFQPCCKSYKKYSFPLQGGVGIGIEGDEEGAGTLGGFLEDEEGKRYILSCEHVLRPCKSSDNPVIVQPAEIDYKASLDEASSDVDQWRSILEKREENLSVCTSDKRCRREELVKEARERVTESMIERQKVDERKQRQIGKYVCGLKKNWNHFNTQIYVDAAIAELNDEEAEEIELSKDDEPENDRCPVFGFKNMKKGFAPTGKIVELKDFDDPRDLQLVKIGRITGLTVDGKLDPSYIYLNVRGYNKNTCAGNLSDIPYRLFCSSCQPPSDENQVDLSGLETPRCANCKRIIKNEDDTSTFWAKNCLAIVKSKKSFCERGDSGALVFDKEGRAWGMVFGVFIVESICCEIGLAAPLGVTLDALENISGKKLLNLWCIKE